MAGKVNKTKVINAAQKYIQKGQLDRAIREYAKIVEEDPRDVRIWLKMGDLCARRGDNREAVETYLKVAEFYSEQGFYLKAVAVYKQILKIDASQINVNLRLAELYRQLGLLSDAIQQYERMASLYQQQERVRDAISSLRQVVELAPDNVASRIKLAELCSKEQLRPEAIEEFTKAADYLRANSRIDDFIKVAERLVYHQPDNVAVLKELAGLYLRRRDPRRALQKLQIAFKVAPRDEEVLKDLAQAFQDLGQVPKTISVLRELAHILRESRQESRCLAAYERILELAPTDEEARQALASRVPRSSQHREPIVEPRMAPPPFAPVSLPPEQEQLPPVPVLDDHLEQAAAGLVETPTPVDPEPPTVDRATIEAESARIVDEADVYIKYGLNDKAVDHLRQVFSIDPDNREARLRLAEVYARMGRAGAAVGELLTVAKQLKDAEPAAAIEALKRALELDAHDEEARRLLNALEGQADVITPRLDALGEDLPDQGFDQPWEDTSAVHAISLDPEDIVEEIPIESSGLLELDSGDDVLLPPVVLDDELRVEVDNSVGGTGLIELHGETTDTLGGGTPSSEVIALPATPRREEAHERIEPREAEGSDLSDDLEEADFFIQQALYAEAHGILDDLLARVPGHPLVAAKLRELRELESVQDTNISSLADSRSAANEIASDLAKDLETSEAVAEPAESGERGNEGVVDDVFEDLKQGVQVAQVGIEDHDTHYDLGIAYREMGLLDDAVTEFRVAMRSPQKEVLCHMMIGLCLADQGQLAEAINEFKTGLYVEGISERETVALYFELGDTYERLEDHGEALYYFEMVERRDSHFRDVEERIRAMRGRVAAGSVGSESAAGSGDDERQQSSKAGAGAQSR